MAMRHPALRQPRTGSVAASEGSSALSTQASRQPTRHSPSIVAVPLPRRMTAARTKAAEEPLARPPVRVKPPTGWVRWVRLRPLRLGAPYGWKPCRGLQRRPLPKGAGRKDRGHPLT